MNNNQENFNNNLGINNQNINMPTTYIPNNSESTLNVIPQMVQTDNNQQNFITDTIPNRTYINSNNQQINLEIQDNTNQFDNTFFNRNMNVQMNINNQNENNFNNNSLPVQKTPIIGNNYNELNNILPPEQNKFIGNNINQVDTTLDNLNVDGEYNNIPKVDYTNDPQVIQNLQAKKKNTITITSEGKVFIIIVLVLLLFIFILPTIFDFIGTIKYR